MCITLLVGFLPKMDTFKLKNPSKLFSDLPVKDITIFVMWLGIYVAYFTFLEALDYSPF